jgi:hypothetical protein
MVTTPQWVAVLVCIVGVLPAAAAPQQFDVPAGYANEVLFKFAGQSRRSLLYDFELLKPFKTHEVKGALDEATALRIMLAGSGLEFSFPSATAISVRPIQHRKTPTHSGPRFAPAPEPAPCICALIVDGAAVGPWCWQQDPNAAELTYAPESCP